MKARIFYSIMGTILAAGVIYGAYLTYLEEQMWNILPASSSNMVRDATWTLRAYSDSLKPTFSRQYREGFGDIYTTTILSTSGEGDAKWYFDSKPVKKGEYYRFVDHYQSDTVSQVVVEFTKDGAPPVNRPLDEAPATIDVGKRLSREYLGYFQVPDDGKVSIYHLINQKGTLSIWGVTLNKVPSYWPALNRFYYPIMAAGALAALVWFLTFLMNVWRFLRTVFKWLFFRKRKEMAIS